MSEEQQVRIVAAALTLPPEVRADLAERLLASLDSPRQAEIDAAWAEEIERRINDLDSGKTKAIAGEEVFRRIFARLK